MLKPIILVTGATGAQGGSVAHSLLDENRFAVRCLTRNPFSDNAIALQNRGAEIVQGDLDDIESLKRAMEGCYGVFGLTNFWEHFGHEAVHGKNLVDAVKSCHISHFVFSTLPDYNKLSGGKFSVPHVDGKAALEQYARTMGVEATFVHIAFYYENFLTFFRPQPGADGTHTFGFPQGDSRLGAVSVEDIGKVIAGVFNDPDRFLGTTLKIVGDDKTCAEYAAIMSRILQSKYVYQHIDREVYASFGFPGADDLANMFEVQRLYPPDNNEGLRESYRLNPSMKSFEAWMIKYADLFSVPQQ